MGQCVGRMSTEDVPLMACVPAPIPRKTKLREMEGGRKKGISQLLHWKKAK